MFSLDSFILFEFKTELYIFFYDLSASSNDNLLKFLPEGNLENNLLD